MDSLGVMGRGDRALDDRDVVGPLDRCARRLEEVRDLNRFRDGEQLVLAVEQAELAAVAGGELPHGERRSGRGAHSSLIANHGASSLHR